jgi:uncharacterized membrane-anchored protein
MSGHRERLTIKEQIVRIDQIQADIFNKMADVSAKFAHAGAKYADAALKNAQVKTHGLYLAIGGFAAGAGIIGAMAAVLKFASH